MDSKTRDVMISTARAHANDLYLSAVLAPSSVSDDLLVLAAFIGEVSRIPFVVTEPMIGEIRLQWWRDWLARRDGSKTSGNLVADAFSRVLESYNIPIDVADRFLSAYVFELYGVMEGGSGTYDAYLSDVGGGVFQLSGHVLGVDVKGRNLQFLRTAGEAYAIIRLLRNLADYRARGRWVLPSDAGVSAADGNYQTVRVAIMRAEKTLQRARQLRPNVSRDVVGACLPAALVEPYLRALQSGRKDPQAEAVDVSPLARVWTLWRAKLRGTI